VSGDYVYIITWDGGPQKIGRSNKPAGRLIGLQTAIPHSLQVARTWHRPLNDANLVERTAHRLLHSARMAGEWFNVTTDEAVIAIEEAIERITNPVPPPPKMDLAAMGDGTPEAAMLEAMHEAIRRVGGLTALGRALGTSPQAVFQWKKAPAVRVLEIERLSGVSRYELRPDVYGEKADK
jgi:hypothetical protein